MFGSELFIDNESVGKALHQDHRRSSPGIPFRSFFS